jgi:hypothetical protein
METPAERITGFLASNASRVMDLLIAWDKDKNGLISRQEFYAFIKGALGFVVKREVADSLFDTFDEDGSGSIDYIELMKSARKAAFSRGKRVGGDMSGTRQKSALSYINQYWEKRNAEHQAAWKKQVQQWRDEDEAARMAMVAAKREALMDRLGQKRTAGHTKGAARREPYPLRRQADAVHAAETVAQWDECWRQEVVFLPPIFQATARSKMTTMNLTSPRHLDTASAANDRESEVLGIHTLPDIPVLTHDDAAAAYVPPVVEKKKKAAPVVDMSGWG